MNIAILSSASAGGAGIAAYRIFEALSSTHQNNIDFFDITALGAVDQSISPQRSATNNRITNTHFTFDYATESRQWVINLLSKYDVINIQWASYLISTSEILALAKLGKKILFTLHDFYYITGGCHYPAGCLGYLNGCHACPQVDENICDQSTVQDSLIIKHTIFSHANVHLSAPSAFITESAIRSEIVPRNRAHVLRNAYTPILNANTEKPENSYTLLLIADTFDEERKGLALAVESIKNAASALCTNTREFQLHLVGGLDVEVIKRLDNTGVKVISHGHIKQHEKLVDIFQQCQFVLSCSYEDNWPNILVESASYGCIPIVGHWHGCEEFTSTFSTGVVADNYSANSFAKAIVSAFSISPDARKRIATRLTQEVRETHAYAQAAQAYESTFNEITDDGKDIQNKTSKDVSQLVSRNHLITNIKLAYQHSKSKGEGSTCTIKSKATPFGSPEDDDFAEITIGSLNDHTRENNFQNEILRKTSTKGYGLKSYFITVK